MPKFWLLVALVCAIGCGREERRFNQPDPASVELQNSIDERAKLARENKELRKKLEAAQQVKKPVEDDERLCTLEYAKAKDPGKLEAITAKWAAAKAEYEKQLAEREKKISEAESLPSDPLPDFPFSPPLNWDISVPSPGMKAIYGEDKLCHLKEVAQEPFRSFGGTNNHWRMFIREAMDNFQDNDIEDDLEYDDFRSSVRTIEMLKDPGEGRQLADNLLSVLVKSPTSMQWAVGLILRLENQDFLKVRLRRLYKASKTDFAKLDADMLTALGKYMKEHPEIKVMQNPGSDVYGPEFDFGPFAQDGNYYKGLLFRYWRYKEEVQGRGKGDKFIRDLQKTMKEVAKGMKVNLQ